MKILLEGLQNKNNFNDEQIQGQTKLQQRNVAREIKQLLELNYPNKPNLSSDTKKCKKYVLDIFGVIPIPKYTNSKVM